MGYHMHRAIVITSTDEVLIEEVREKARAIGLPVANKIASALNAFWTVLVGPDGCKEGWESSDEFQNMRANFVRWLRDRQLEEGGSSLEWVAVRYGADATVLEMPTAEITDHRWIISMHELSAMGLCTMGGHAGDLKSWPKITHHVKFRNGKETIEFDCCPGCALSYETTEEMEVTRIKKAAT